MTVRWVRLDTAFPRNRKVAELLTTTAGHKAVVSYICALALAGEQGTNGFISRASLPFIYARTADVNKLVEVGMFIPDDGGGGWWINDWAEYQPTDETMQKRSDAARKAANVRWAKEQTKTPKRDP